MNKTQKYFVIIGVTSFLYWFMKPLPWNGGYPIYSMIWHQFILGLDFFPLTSNSKWYSSTDSIFSFSIMIGCVLGYYLFKDE